MMKEFRIPFIVALVLVAAALGLWWYFANGAKDVKQAIEANGAERVARQWSGATLKTNYGSVQISFLHDKAPKTVANFIALVEKGFFDGTKFHRVIADFMIQGGDPLSKDDTHSELWGTGGPGYQFADEINDEKFMRGAVAMANSGPNTNGSQFFVVTAKETPWLAGKHTIFAKVTAGLDVALAISHAEVGARDIPKSPIILEKVILK
ncbi:MAG: peptidyl-prolyl cis-trans isomerase B (cyclophilin B) [Parcubacteria group bacterium Gr01-1014_17]|nr:MAG: peptidyl-prolyl cis-trans isomerase B (cyclophilin B) [Parcubacteria group bacterium Gr01-1014_17]